MHSFHLKIGDLIYKTFSGIEGNLVLLEKACGGKIHLPLFYSDNKCYGTALCKVDILILKKEEVRIIIEIEESSFNPVNIFGKYLASAYSKMFIHDKVGKFKMSESVAFIEILDLSKLSAATSKELQYEFIENKIQTLNKKINSNISEYKMIYGSYKINDKSFIFPEEELINYINKKL